MVDLSHKARNNAHAFLSTGWELPTWNALIMGNNKDQLSIPIKDQ